MNCKQNSLNWFRDQALRHRSGTTREVRQTGLWSRDTITASQQEEDRNGNMHIGEVVKINDLSIEYKGNSCQIDSKKKISSVVLPSQYAGTVVAKDRL